LADRTLTGEQYKLLAGRLAPFSGVLVDAIVYGNTPEILRFTAIIMQLLQSVGWVVEGPSSPLGAVAVGGILASKIGVRVRFLTADPIAGGRRGAASAAALPPSGAARRPTSSTICWANRASSNTQPPLVAARKEGRGRAADPGIVDQEIDRAKPAEQHHDLGGIAAIARPELAAERRRRRAIASPVPAALPVVTASCGDFSIKKSSSAGASRGLICGNRILAPSR
jgi:hypothetical protein